QLRSLLLSDLSRPHRLSFFSPAPPPTPLYTLSLHDALPIFPVNRLRAGGVHIWSRVTGVFRWNSARLPCGSDLGDGSAHRGNIRDRKSTRLNSSHVSISYAVFCLKKKRK